MKKPAARGLEVMDEEQRRARIKQMIEALQVPDEEKWRIPFAITELVCITQPSPMSPQQLKGVQRSFRDASADSTKRELRALASIRDDEAARLVELTATLRQPAILLLADFGWLRDVNDIDGARVAAKRALERIKSGRWASQIGGFRGPPTEQRGRPFNLQGQGIALVAARVYMQLTGNPITGSHHIDKDDSSIHPMGEFYSLVKELFYITGIKNNAEAAIHGIRKRYNLEFLANMLVYAQKKDAGTLKAWLIYARYMSVIPSNVVKTRTQS